MTRPPSTSATRTARPSAGTSPVRLVLSFLFLACVVLKRRVGVRMHDVWGMHCVRTRVRLRSSDPHALTTHTTHHTPQNHRSVHLPAAARAHRGGARGGGVAGAGLLHLGVHPRPRRGIYLYVYFVCVSVHTSDQPTTHQPTTQSNTDQPPPRHTNSATPPPAPVPPPPPPPPSPPRRSGGSRRRSRRGRGRRRRGARTRSVVIVFGFLSLVDRLRV